MATCEHLRVAIGPCDQTVEVYCLDCRLHLAACWDPEHIPESLWNRACENDPDDVQPIRCEQSRDDVCAICERLFHKEP